jgi:hypothetical protein
MSNTDEMVSKRSARAYSDDGCSIEEEPGNRFVKQDEQLPPQSDATEKSGWIPPRQEPMNTREATKDVPFTRNASLLGAFRTHYCPVELSEESNFLKTPQIIYPLLPTSPTPHKIIATGYEPVNFGMVVPGVYRSSYPKPDNFNFFQDLGLKTIM